MKIKKIILIIIFLFVLTGCTSRVNIEISNSIVYEEITIDDRTTPKESFRNYIPVYNTDEIVDTEPDIREENKEYYKKEIKDDKYVYSYAFKVDQYNESKSMKKLFSSSSLINSERTGLMELYTSSDGIFAFDLYPNLTRLEINIVTELEVEESNADSVNGNKYTWVFTPNNKTKGIYMRMRNYRYNDTHTKKNREENAEASSKNNNSSNINNENNNGDSNSNGGNNVVSKADIKYKEKKTAEEEKEERSNQLLLAVIVIFGFLILLFIIGKIKIKKNR